MLGRRDTDDRWTFFKNFEARIKRGDDASIMAITGEDNNLNPRYLNAIAEKHDNSDDFGRCDNDTFNDNDIITITIVVLQFFMT